MLERIRFYDMDINPRVFSNIDLPAVLPKLRVFAVKNCNQGKLPFEVPDMSRCEKLEEVKIYACSAIPSVPSKVTFP